LARRRPACREWACRKEGVDVRRPGRYPAAEIPPVHFGGWGRGRLRAASAFQGEENSGKTAHERLHRRFNLYYGLVKRAEKNGVATTQWRWLNLMKLAQFLLQDSQIAHVHYFTAMIKNRGDDPQRVLRQQVFLRALRTLPNLTIHLGNYQETKVWRPLARPPKRGSRFVQVLWSEEKGSDVNLATQLLMDTYERTCTRAAVISNDSDLARPIEVAAGKLTEGVVVFNPHPGETAWRLKKVATEYRSISDKVLRATVFADVLKDEHGEITKPREW
jgi:NYN domain